MAKSVNDQYGHATGDLLLATLAARIRETVRGDDLVVIMDSAAWTPRVRYGAQSLKERLQAGGEPPIGKVLVKVRGK